MDAQQLRRQLLVVGMLLAGMAQAVEEFPRSLVGDVGLGTYTTRSIVRSKGDLLSVLPYADFEYGRLFARVDTFGIKTLPLGYGYLELVGRVNQDGFDADTPALHGLRARDTSVPLGIGTLQITPVGGFWINAFRDVRSSGGKIAEFTWGGELKLADVTFYPLLGAEYQSREYVRYYYGISVQEAANSQYASYQPAGAFNEFAGLIADIRLTDEYHLNCFVRHKWLGDAIRQSPIVSSRYLDTGYIALSYRFK